MAFCPAENNNGRRAQLLAFVKVGSQKRFLVPEFRGSRLPCPGLLRGPVFPGSP
jgi:hypothetical protein